MTSELPRLRIDDRRSEADRVDLETDTASHFGVVTWIPEEMRIRRWEVKDALLFHHGDRPFDAADPA